MRTLAFLRLTFSDIVSKWQKVADASSLLKAALLEKNQSRSSIFFERSLKEKDSRLKRSNKLRAKWTFWNNSKTIKLQKMTSKVSKNSTFGFSYPKKKQPRRTTVIGMKNQCLINVSRWLKLFWLQWIWRLGARWKTSKRKASS